MSDRSAIRTSVVLGLALSGVLLGHTMAYRIALPDAHDRAAELARSGHGYLGGANALGLIAAVVALSVVFLRRLLRPTGSVPLDVFWRLCSFQLAAFGAMEMLERIGSGSGLHDLVPLALVGVPAQLLVAAVVTLGVRSVLRAAARVAELVARGPHRDPILAAPSPFPS
jgi:hypothetical protein